ncbi:serine/threonine-protein kinase [Bradymonas sediminis]|uniref:Protein kinase domain-containing protein n=1 Tax=Bradymonas sediminis TaxID=1548548 RepID=A0A2Z4FHF1_9DELT|nr:serine/threonine-protein kinase [Bradymonas sediminis]AWV88144.1 hypothetical protein DN745_01855 [Bradymonas sediminis]TDP77267.1 serine/threonine protein kinase [Bradymonas sediminis]
MSNEPGILPKPVPFGKYYLLERINVGGMAEVYKAKAFGVEGFERLLAVKKILASIAEDESFINMFIDEAKISGSLSHPNLTKIFDLGKVDGSYFIAMEYISGKDIKTIFERARRIGEKVDIPRVCYIIMKVCEGLAYAHDKVDSQGNPLNIVHRDVSPQNVLISYEGEVKVIDFGIAKSAGKQSETEVGILKGKFSYMSPEQVRGLHVDHRSDIFSVGILLYEMLTLERLFLGESDFDTLEKIRKVEISPPSLYNPHIPKELEDIVLKALARSSEERFSTAHELAEALERFMRNQGYYFTNKDLAASMKGAFNADIEFEKKKYEYYQSLNLQPPDEQGEPVLAAPDGGGGLSWGEEEMETQIFDRMSEEIEFVSESQIVYADDADVLEIDEFEEFDDLDGATIEFDRWDVKKQFEAHHADAAPDAFDGGARLDMSDLPAPRQRSHTASLPVIPQERRDPQHTVQTMSPVTGEKRNPYLVIALVCLLIVGLGLAFFFMKKQPTNPVITFNTEPEVVDIFINGEKIYSGKTPYVYEPAAGAAEIRIESEGYEAFVTSHELKNGGTYPLTHTLRQLAPETGQLLVKTEPDGAMLKLQGQSEAKKAPLTLEDMVPGSYDLEATLDDYLTENQKVEVKPGSNEVTIKLRPKKVSLTVKSEPARAYFGIYEAGEKGKRIARGRTPQNVKDLDGSKSYRVVMEMSGYDEFERAFEPGTKKEDELVAELVKVEKKPAPETVVASASSSKQPASGSKTSRTNDDSRFDPPPRNTTKPAPKPEPKPEPKPAPKPKPAGVGTITIGSKPVARIYIDGKDTGRYTPLIKFKIKAGNHKVRLVNEDFGLDKTVYLEVEAGENKTYRNQ